MRPSTPESDCEPVEVPVGERRPKAIGIVDWKTIAPVMLPSARLSLPSLTQKKLLAFSGSSVASGASTSERTSGSIPSVLGDA